MTSPILRVVKRQRPNTIQILWIVKKNQEKANNSPAIAVRLLKIILIREGGRHTFIVERLELSLALVEFLVVALLYGHSGVCFVHCDCEVIPNALHCQVLPHRPQLVTYVHVVLYKKDFTFFHIYSLPRFTIYSFKHSKNSWVSNSLNATLQFAQRKVYFKYYCC